MRLRSSSIIGASAVLFAVALVGCSEQPTSAAAPTSTATATALIATGTVPAVTNDLASNSAHHSLDVPGEQFALTVDYWTDYDAASWQTLQPKKINLSVHLAPTATTSGTPPEVLIGSFSGVTSLMAAMPGLDGLPIAATEQHPNGVAGYLINVNYPYDNVLTIEGFSSALAARWASVAGDQALTESGLAAAGVYANRITFTYGILVRNTGDAGYHQRILQDTITVTQAAQTPAASATVTAPTSG